LLRFETNGAALWFKAVGEPNAHEHAITLQLSDLFPSYLPDVIASKREWNAWLSVEAPGQHLSQKSRIDEWQSAVTALADLQIASLGNGLHLIDAGCRDVRACSLLERVDGFFDRIAELMENQAKLAPPPLKRSELASLAQEIRKSLEEFNESEIPNVLGHLDCNPGNILVSQERCIFLDWAEGCIGHPFFTFQYLLEHWRRFHGVNASAEKAILSAYTIPWQSFVSSCDLAAALRLTPLLGVFAYASVGHTWRNGSVVDEPETATFLRSLARRMQREADTIQQRRLTCVP
jgi:aminoglycoside phosphotransferase (APT) family kinase protein